MALTQTVRSAVIDETSDGDNTVVAAVSGKKIRVLGYVVGVTAAGTVQWKSGAATALSGAMEFVEGGGATAPLSPEPNEVFWFETAAGEALVLNTGIGVDAKGHVTYQEVS